MILSKPFSCGVLLLMSSLVFPSISVAQTPDYFPLEVGAIWIFRPVNGGPQESTAFKTVWVEAEEPLDSDKVGYFKVHYFGRTVYLRSQPNSWLMSFNADTGTGETWLNLGAPEGSSFDTHIDECSQRGLIESRRAEVTTPVGAFTDVVQVKFQGRCLDAGTAQEFYAPGVGPVVHEETMIAGTQRYELVFFRPGSPGALAQQRSFAISLDAPRYSVGGNLFVWLTLQSTHPDPVLLHFPTGQRFELKIFNEAGDVMYVWSADKRFSAEGHDETFGRGLLTDSALIPLGAIPPGRYRIQGYLTTSPQTYLAESTFEIVH
jgi:hypothetical protein